MTIDSKYGVPTVAIHTDIFERVVRSVARVNGMPRTRAVFVPQPVMGKTAARAARLRRRQRPDHRPAGHAGGHRRPDAAVRRRGPEEGRLRADHAAAGRAGHRGRTCTSCSSTTTGPTRCRSSCRPKSAWRRCSRTPATSRTRSSATCGRRSSASPGSTRSRKSR